MAAQLHRYRDQYLQHGAQSCVALTLPLVNVLKGRQVDQSLFGWQLPTDRPDIVHVFSNNGFIAAGILMKFWPGFAESVKKWIFDSSPSIQHVRTRLDYASELSLGIAPWLFPNKPKLAQQLTSTALIPTIVAHSFVYPQAYHQLAVTASRWQEHCPNPEILFLAGYLDRVVHLTKIRTYFENAQQQNQKCQLHVFPEAEHVQLAKSNPMLYWSLTLDWCGLANQAAGGT